MRRHWVEAAICFQYSTYRYWRRDAKLKKYWRQTPEKMSRSIKKNATSQMAYDIEGGWYGKEGVRERNYKKFLIFFNSCLVLRADRGMRREEVHVTKDQ